MSRIKKSGWAVVAALGASLVAGDAPAADAASGYRLGPQDRVLLRVGQWRRDEGVYRAWDTLGGEYAIGGDGRLQVPMIGAVQAAGQSTEALAAEVSARLVEALGLTDPLGVAIEIAAYRPFYVTGAVETPGAHAYRPGMTVAEAVGIAGGVARRERSFVRGARDALRALGEIEVLRLDAWRAEARRVRLMAELGVTSDVEAAEIGADDIVLPVLEMPEALDDVPVADRLMATEREILSTRLRTFRSSLEQIDGLVAVLERRIETLGRQIELREEQVVLAEEELASIRTLTEQGLAVTSRRVSRERIVSDLRSSVLDLEGARLEAEQDLAEAGRDRVDLVSQRRETLVTELGDTRREIDRIAARMRTEEGLAAEAIGIGDGFVLNAGRAAARYEITRPGGETVEAAPGTPVAPGDILSVVVDAAVLGAGAAGGAAAGAADD
ncbi:MAG: polysaccharide biosynthesis/export family protein [Pseudomonadota bacterium]